MTDEKWNEYLEKIGRLRERVNTMADAEAKSALHRGPEARGALFREKMRLVDECDRLLDEVEHMSKVEEGADDEKAD